jgi:hypothetical protein
MNIILQEVKHLERTCDASVVGVRKNRFQRRFDFLPNSLVTKWIFKGEITYAHKDWFIREEKEVDTIAKCFEL